MRISLVLAIAATLSALVACTPSYAPLDPDAFALPATDADFHSNPAPTPERLALGQSLFFDKLLSGNRNISCATCHSVQAATSDGLSLSIGEDGAGSGIFRRAKSVSSSYSERVPRNAPALFNLGAREFAILFNDGRVEAHSDFPSGVKSPAGKNLPPGLSGPLAAQALFPVTSETEMCGTPGENDIAKYCEKQDFPRIWRILEQRLQQTPAYVALFKAAYPEIKSKQQISMVHAANAIALFEATTWRADNSPFDRYLRGDHQALSRSALAGMRLFYGKANCSNCHSGTFQTDQQFHATAMPQLGPGKGDGHKQQDDFGRERVTGDRADRYKFRTPSLRNVALTGPWGHAGAFNTLRGAVKHMLDPVTSLNNYDPRQAVLPASPLHMKQDLEILKHPESVAQILAANEITPVTLSETEIDQLLDFLLALTDPASLDLRGDAPETVASGLPVAD